jgi:hypothetical protein
MHSAFIWYFLSMKGRIGPQEFRLGLLGLVLVDMLVVRIARKLTDSGPQYYSVNPPLDWPIVPAVLFISLWPFAAILSAFPGRPGDNRFGSTSLPRTRV